MRCMRLMWPVVAIASMMLMAATARPTPRDGVPVNGVYRVADTNEGESVLGPLLTTDLGSAQMRATDNGNTRFVLELTGAGPTPGYDGQSHVAIVLAGRSATAFARQMQPDGTLNLSAALETPEHAADAAEALGITPRLRRHPGHRLAVSVAPDRATYKPGETVTLTMSIRNVGERAVRFTDGGRQRGPRNNQFQFIATSGYAGGPAIPDTGDPTNFGGMGFGITIEPGETFEKQANLDDWFRLEKPGFYRITALYDLSIDDDWDDFAVAQCHVRIVAAAE